MKVSAGPAAIVFLTALVAMENLEKPEKPVVLAKQ